MVGRHFSSYVLALGFCHSSSNESNDIEVSQVQAHRSPTRKAAIAGALGNTRGTRGTLGSLEATSTSARWVTGLQLSHVARMKHEAESEA